MSITLVLHEATRTGAPRVGGLIAKELASSEDVHVIVLKDGPLAPWLRDLLGDEQSDRARRRENSTFAFPSRRGSGRPRRCWSSGRTIWSM